MEGDGEEGEAIGEEDLEDEGSEEDEGVAADDDATRREEDEEDVVLLGVREAHDDHSVEIAPEPVGDHGQCEDVGKGAAQVEHEVELRAADPGEEGARSRSVLLLNRFLEAPEGNTVQQSESTANHYRWEAGGKPHR